MYHQLHAECALIGFFGVERADNYHRDFVTMAPPPLLLSKYPLHFSVGKVNYFGEFTIPDH